jgi:hypothetical protein
LHKKAPLLLLGGSPGRSGHNSAAPCARPGQGRAATVRKGREQGGRGWGCPELALQTAGLRGPRWQCPGTGTRQPEPLGWPVQPSQDSSSCCLQLDKHGCCRRRRRLPRPRSFPQLLPAVLIALTNFQLASQVCGGWGGKVAAPAHTLHPTHTTATTTTSRLPKGGGGPGAHERPGRRHTGRAGRKFAAARPARPEPGW